MIPLHRLATRAAAPGLPSLVVAVVVGWSGAGSVGVVRAEPVPPAPAVPAASAPRPAPAALPSPPLPRALDWRPLAAIVLAAAGIGGFRLAARRRRPPLPAEVFEVLGTAPFAAGQSVRVVRFGPKTVLVAVSAAGCQALAELDDPQATEALVALCAAPPPPRPQPRVRPAWTRAAALLVAATLVWTTAPAAAADEGRANAPAEIGVEPLQPVPPLQPATGDAAALLPGVARFVGSRPLDAVLPSLLLVGVMTLAPALLLMTTCFVRMSVVLSLVRLGLGAPQVPSNQIVAALALFLSGLVMWPVWNRAWQEGVEPWQQGRLPAVEAFDRGSLPVRRWMAAQIEHGGHRETMRFFLARHPAGPRTATSYDDVPVEALLPAFLVSELETAFAIGLRLLLPFLVIDILVATLVVSTGLVMLPPTLVAVPLKLLAFVAADGWTLVIRSLLDSVRTAVA